MPVVGTSTGCSRCIDCDGEKFRVDPQAESRTSVAAVFVEASKPNRRWAKQCIFSAGLVFYTLWERTMKVQEIVMRAMSKQITWWQAAEILGVSTRTMRRMRRGSLLCSFLFVTPVRASRAAKYQGSAAQRLLTAPESVSRFRVRLSENAVLQAAVQRSAI